MPKITTRQILSYNSLLKAKPNARYYASLAQAEKDKKDTSAYVKTLAEARLKFPEDNNLLIEEINYYLSKGKASLVLDRLKSAIDKDPKNTSLYVVLGSSYESTGKIDSAEAIYKRAIAVDPKNFAANFNIGAIYYNRAASILTKAIKLSKTKVKEYNAEVLKFKKTFEQAIPYLETAHAVKPDDRSTITSLKEIYTRTNHTEKLAELNRSTSSKK